MSFEEIVLPIWAGSVSVLAIYFFILLFTKDKGNESEESYMYDRGYRDGQKSLALDVVEVINTPSDLDYEEYYEKTVESIDALCGDIILLEDNQAERWVW